MPPPLSKCSGASSPVRKLPADWTRSKHASPPSKQAEAQISGHVAGGTYVRGVTTTHKGVVGVPRDERRANPDTSGWQLAVKRGAADDPDEPQTIVWIGRSCVAVFHLAGRPARRGARRRVGDGAVRCHRSRPTFTTTGVLIDAFDEDEAVLARAGGLGVH